jgi:hypothetical protein
MSHKKISNLKQNWLEFTLWAQDRREDITSPIEDRWRSFKQWRRKRNPELVELDAFRRIVELERKLKEYPTAVPLLTELMHAYKATRQEDKRLDVMRRLRDIDSPEMKEEGPPANNCPKDVDKELYGKALALVRSGFPAKAGALQRRLCIGYCEAEKICDIMIDNHVIDPDTRELIAHQ